MSDAQETKNPDVIGQLVTVGQHALAENRGEIVQNLGALSAFVDIASVAELVQELTEVEAVSGLMGGGPAEIRRKGTEVLLQQRIALDYPIVSRVDKGKIDAKSIVDPRKEIVAVAQGVAIDKVTPAVIKSFNTKVAGWRNKFGYLSSGEIVKRIEEALTAGDVKMVRADRFVEDNTKIRSERMRDQAIAAWLDSADGILAENTKFERKTGNVTVPYIFSKCYALSTDRPTDGDEVVTVDGVQHIRYAGEEWSLVDVESVDVYEIKKLAERCNKAIRTAWLLGHLHSDVVKWNDNSGYPDTTSKDGKPIPEHLVAEELEPEVPGADDAPDTDDAKAEVPDADAKAETDAKADAETDAKADAKAEPTASAPITEDEYSGIDQDELDAWAEVETPADDVLAVLGEFLCRPSAVFAVLAEESIRVLADRKAGKLSLSDPLTSTNATFSEMLRQSDDDASDDADEGEELDDDDDE